MLPCENATMVPHKSGNLIIFTNNEASQRSLKTKKNLPFFTSRELGSHLNIFKVHLSHATAKFQLEFQNLNNVNMSDFFFFCILKQIFILITELVNRYFCNHFIFVIRLEITAKSFFLRWCLFPSLKVAFIRVYRNPLFKLSIFNWFIIITYH